MGESEIDPTEQMPFRPYKRFVPQAFGVVEFHGHLQKAILQGGAEENELLAVGGRLAVLASIRRHLPDFDPAEARSAYSPAWVKLKPILVRSGLNPVDEITTLTDIKAFLDAAQVAPADEPDRGEKKPMAPNRTNPPPPDCNLAMLLGLLDAEQKAASGGGVARWEMSRISELPEIQILCEQIGLARPGGFSSATVKAIVSRLCMQCAINQQEAYGLPLSRVADLLREQVKSSVKEAVMPDARNVFVIHGRNGAARDAMFEFLRAVGLNPIEWGEAVKMTGKGAPFVGEILDAAFSNAQAIVVILTGDDLAHLREEFQEPHDPDHETNPTPQARPNVLFEAGMAFGRHPERTIMVQIGMLRQFSDVAGRHTLHFRNTAENRSELRDRLKTAKCAVKEAGADWLKAGKFDEALRLAEIGTRTIK